MFFSILLPSKNGENYIANCISSILDQDFESYELIIGNNNNSINFVDIIDPFLKLTDKIKIINHKKSLPVHENWQSCLDVASGKYILMLGDDMI